MPNESWSTRVEDEAETEQPSMYMQSPKHSPRMATRAFNPPPPRRSSHMRNVHIPYEDDFYDESYLDEEEAEMNRTMYEMSLGPNPRYARRNYDDYYDPHPDEEPYIPMGPPPPHPMSPRYSPRYYNDYTDYPVRLPRRRSSSMHNDAFVMPGPDPYERQSPLVYLREPRPYNHLQRSYSNKSHSIPPVNRRRMSLHEPTFLSNGDLNVEIGPDDDIYVEHMDPPAHPPRAERGNAHGRNTGRKITVRRPNSVSGQTLYDNSHDYDPTMANNRPDNHNSRNYSRSREHTRSAPNSPRQSRSLSSDEEYMHNEEIEIERRQRRRDSMMPRKSSLRRRMSYPDMPMPVQPMPNPVLPAVYGPMMKDHLSHPSSPYGMPVYHPSMDPTLMGDMLPMVGGMMTPHPGMDPMLSPDGMNPIPPMMDFRWMNNQPMHGGMPMPNDPMVGPSFPWNYYPDSWVTDPALNGPSNHDQMVPMPDPNSSSPPPVNNTRETPNENTTDRSQPPANEQSPRMVVPQTKPSGPSFFSKFFGGNTIKKGGNTMFRGPPLDYPGGLPPNQEMTKKERRKREQYAKFPKLWLWRLRNAVDYQILPGDPKIFRPFSITNQKIIQKEISRDPCILLDREKMLPGDHVMINVLQNTGCSMIRSSATQKYFVDLEISVFDQTNELYNF
ncbi:hypothetical protein BDB01DRAFT_783403 [Pilobolus umbonatus]|nr:hypothetical protein BDB01DRAFT_783403 [Pilobolus umbonatus]